MAWAIVIMLVALWGLGLTTGNTIQGFIHILLAIALIVALVRVVQWRRP